ncbi:hypothetical protein [Metasolibacillus meyeri]|uniref:hypothetical protein n=1 Tax=Metasolibacillus meyeri TaxID=1071052 RepID=UPI000D30E8EB|nr:hypothetical protein [Metasolibacillus meyeri]
MKKLTLLLVIMSVFMYSIFSGSGTRAFATAVKEALSTDDLLINADVQLEAHIYYENGKPFVDIEKAKADGLAGEYIEIGLMLNQISSSSSINQADTVNAAGISIPIWGNWCGPGYGSGILKDVLDKGCQTHDKCYEDKGYFNCDCDAQLVDYIEKNFSEMAFIEKLFAIAIKIYFKYTFCSPFKWGWIY